MPGGESTVIVLAVGALHDLALALAGAARGHRTGIKVEQRRRQVPALHIACSRSGEPGRCRPWYPRRDFFDQRLTKTDPWAEAGVRAVRACMMAA